MADEINKEQAISNMEHLQTIYTDFINVLSDISFSVTQAKDLDEIDELVSSADKISTVLKRLGETTVLELIADDEVSITEDKPNDKGGELEIEHK